jgi:hypothetical protein
VRPCMAAERDELDEVELVGKPVELVVGNGRLGQDVEEQVVGEACCLRREPVVLGFTLMARVKDRIQWVIFYEARFSFLPFLSNFYLENV